MHKERVVAAAVGEELRATRRAPSAFPPPPSHTATREESMNATHHTRVTVSRQWRREILPYTSSLAGASLMRWDGMTGTLNWAVEHARPQFWPATE